ncbi:MAG: hypothetical protein WD738_12055 [Pirellulales bacterium]
MIAMFIFGPIGPSEVILGAIGVTAIWMYRHKRSNKSACRGRGWWPALLLVPALGLFLWGNVRIQTTQHQRAVAEEQRAVAKVQAALASRLASIRADAEHQIATMNIHELMDKADAPQIALPPDAPAPPEAPAEAASAERAEDAEENPEPSQAEVEPKSATEGASESDAAATKSNSDEAASETESARETKDNADSAPEASAEPDVADDEDATIPGRSDDEFVSRENDGRRGPSRPAWVDETPKRVGNTHRDVIVTDEYATIEECYEATDISLLAKTNARIEKLTNDNWSFGSAHNLGIGLDYIRREIATDEYVETVERSFGPMKKMYTLIEFSPAVDRELKVRWDAHRRQERFAMVGKGAGSVLALVALVWGLLRIDTVTKGYYTKRLFLGVPAAIIGVFLLLLLIDMAT